MKISPIHSFINSFNIRRLLLFIAHVCCGLFYYVALMPSASFGFDGDLESEIQSGLAESRAIVATIQNKLKSGASITSELMQLKSTADNVNQSYLLLEERFSLREEKVKTLGSTALSRQQAMAEGYRKALMEYLDIVDGIPSSSQESGDSSQEKINKLKTLLDNSLPLKKRPIIGSLPYKHLNYPAREPNALPAITPAYKGGNGNTTSADLNSTIEAPITEEIAELALSLNWNPVLMYEYVKNNVDTEWYWGCMKGAEETLHQKSGSDCDQAALLVALLRAAGYPSRYVRGTMEFFPDIQTAKNITGIDDPRKIAELFQKAGVPYKTILDGTTIRNIQIEHVWVETLVPYSNYRGAIIDDKGKAWLGLDTSIKANGYSYNSAPDIVSEHSLSTTRDDYLSAVQLQTPLEYLRAKINDYLVQSHPTTTYNDYLCTKTLVPEVMQILPGSMQFNQVRITNEYTEIPDELKYKVTFTASDGAIRLFSATLDAMDLSNKKVIINYDPETVEDQEIINGFGGLDNTPCYLVHLRPVLVVDDERVVVGEGGIPMGGEYNLTVTITSANGAETVTNTMISGSMAAIGLAGQKAVIPTDLDEQDAADLLYREAIRYIDNWNRGEEDIASLLHVSLSRPMPAVVTLGNAIEVTYLLDQPHGFTWKGLYLDADLRAVEVVSREASGEREREFMRLSALQGSALEHKLFEDAFGVSSVSTVKVMGIANGTEPPTPVLTIDQSNIAAILSTLPVDDNIKQDITEAVGQNLAIRIPQSETAFEDWTGTGYIKENTTTGEAGYMLSGMVAGGMTAVSPSRWPDQTFSVLSKPYEDSNKKIMVLTPGNESTITYSPVDVTGIVLDPNSTVTVNNVAAEVTGNTFIAYGVKLNPWTNVITATGRNAAGETSRDTVSVTYKIPLDASISFPYDGTSLSVTPVFIEGTVTDPTASVVINNVSATVLADGRFTANNVPLYEGANPVTVTAMNRVGEKATNTVTLNYHAVDPKPALSVSITSPANGVTINNEAVTVSGTITSGAQEMSVMVNGVLSEIYNGQFNANNVPLVEGSSNIIIADAMDANGAIARSQITITANTTAPHVTLSSNIQSGVAPLTTYFSLRTNVTNSITNYQLDFGDGSTPYTGANFDNVSHTYTTEGIFMAMVTITDALANVYTDIVAVSVQNKILLNTLLTNKWNGMKASLQVADIETAVSYISGRFKDAYRQQFTALSQFVPEIVSQFGAITMVNVKNNIAEYDLSTVRNDIAYSFQLKFVRDVDGFWRLNSF